MRGPFESDAAAAWPGAAACGVCGSRELRSDAVACDEDARSWLGLAECARCAHRWTQPLLAPPPRAAARVASGAPLPEVASAA